MIAANVAMAQVLTGQRSLSLRRVVRTPEHLDRIVEIANELGEQLRAQPDSRALVDFFARRKTADPQHFPKNRPSTSVSQYTTIRIRLHPTVVTDLVSQRLVKAVLRKGAGPYTEAELAVIGAH
jgi:exoribonuclease R